MWKPLYDPILQLTSLSWRQYISQYASCGRKVQHIFQYEVYPIIGLTAIIISLLSAIIFYLYLNTRFGRFYSTRTWINALFINSAIVSLITYLITNNALHNVSCKTTAQLTWISIINFLYAAIAFLFF